MEKELQELEQILQRELDLHDALCETAERFNNAIKNNDLEQMQQHTLEQDEKICIIERLEESRIKCCSHLSDKCTASVNSIKLSSIMEGISPVWKNKLTDLQGSLKQSINRLSKINTSNRILLEEANSIINKTFDVIRQSKNHLQSYSSQGKIPTLSSGCTLYNNIA